MSNIYFLYGEERYDLELQIEKIKKEYDNLEIGLNYFLLNKDNVDELSDIIQGITFFGTGKLIIIKDTGLKFNVDLLNDIDQDITIVIVEGESVDKRLSEYKKISKIANCMEFKHMDQKQMCEYVKKILGRYGIKISADTALYFFEICGNNKANNINELQKLVIYLNDEEEKNVTNEIIDKVCSRTLNAKIFDVLSLIVNKKKKEAMIRLDELLEQKESIIKIYIMLYKQIKSMYMIKYLKSKNESNIAQVLGIHPYTLKNLSKTCDIYTMKKLKEIIYSFDEYDEKTKNGEMDFEIGLKKIICSM